MQNKKKRGSISLSHSPSLSACGPETRRPMPLPFSPSSLISNGPAQSRRKQQPFPSFSLSLTGRAHLSASPPPSCRCSGRTRRPKPPPRAHDLRVVGASPRPSSIKQGSSPVTAPPATPHFPPLSNSRRNHRAATVGAAAVVAVDHHSPRFAFVTVFFSFAVVSFAIFSSLSGFFWFILAWPFEPYP